MTVLRYDMRTEYNRFACADEVKEMPCKDGKYVHYEDYEAILKQLTEATSQLNMVLRENAGLRERLLDGNVERVWQD